jgi:hypothetical protein
MVETDNESYVAVTAAEPNDRSTVYALWFCLKCCPVALSNEESKQNEEILERKNNDMVPHSKEKENNKRSFPYKSYGEAAERTKRQRRAELRRNLLILGGDVSSANKLLTEISAKKRPT